MASWPAAAVTPIRLARVREHQLLRNVINMQPLRMHEFKLYLISCLMICCPLGIASAIPTNYTPDRARGWARTASGRHQNGDSLQSSVMTSTLWTSTSRAPAIMTFSHSTSTADPSALEACRNPRNCVVDSPDADDPVLRPIPFRTPIEQVANIMTAVLAGEARTRIVVQNGRYVRAEARSALFRFVDDVELLADEKTGLIHFRSSSRIGRSDFGVNRKRMRRISAAIRQRLAELSPTPT